MEQKRAQTLEALENFIQTHKTLLERTYADIEGLRALRADVANDAALSVEKLAGMLDEPSFKLSEQLDAMPPLPAELDWSLFGGADAAPFKTMATTAREAYAARNVPPKTQLSSPSALRQFVASNRLSIIDPVLTAFRLPDELACISSDEEVDPEELCRAREREKIRELKKRRIEGDALGGNGAAFSGLGLRKPVAGVFIRRDQEDESAEVDISMAEDESARSVPGSTSEVVPLTVDTPATSVASLPPSASVEREALTRERRPTRKAHENAKNVATVKAKAKAKAKSKGRAQAKTKANTEEDSEEHPATEPPADKNGKAKSETYKQAWSVSEQHLLERLLEEIPEGEKNRWAKISKAMNGRRTARQVASRVQKYYEKLKRFGIEVGGSKAGAAAS
ncbi:hypothetical protein DICSQDRAFT_183662 [Dichomitus squalens LYAD-421 SS1]|uniref:Uncharacterized protein n=1 Tax=Dichomitus squalens (strain LYAD-421) TaxID=732165 RepID=R7SP17_DICSQ|nr:uncharacterized protein DICSQDRAFT_183662 [Dichomitus squalens LYAD-421 SS1]EJF56702.1 hypothetical protein DICSQDRAFT_183662 [Dichomitus squalens LYAD-421 SS1]